MDVGLGENASNTLQNIHNYQQVNFFQSGLTDLVCAKMQFGLRL